jgi:hypothetical protein
MLNIDYDFTQLPTRNLDYFIPLQFQIDVEERNLAIQTTVAQLEKQYGHRPVGHLVLPTDPTQWTKTLAICNKFLNPIGLVCRNLTSFVSNKNQTGWTVHKDGYFTEQDRLNNTVSTLEARMSFYELCKGPGAIRWWNEDDIKITLALRPGPIRVRGIADFVEDLQQGKISWNEIPAPAFSSVTTCPSALVRTELAHHVVQGDGFRYVVGTTITFEDGTPTGVWDHIRKNIDRLEV